MIFPLKPSIYKGFSMAMLVITRWSIMTCQAMYCPEESNSKPCAALIGNATPAKFNMYELGCKTEGNWVASYEYGSIST